MKCNSNCASIILDAIHQSFLVDNALFFLRVRYVENARRVALSTISPDNEASKRVLSSSKNIADAFDSSFDAEKIVVYNKFPSDGISKLPFKTD